MGSTPALLQEAVVGAVRGVSIPLSMLGVEATRSMISAAGPAFASLPFNRRRLAKTRDRIAFAFPDWPADRVERTARRVWEHLGSIVAETVFTPRLMNADAWSGQVMTGDIGPAFREIMSGRPTVLVTGHLGNFDLAGTTMALLGMPVHALFRPLDSEPLDRWVRRTREARGMRVVDKFGALRDLPSLVSGGAVPTFVADQNAGDRGLFVPFFGRLTSSYKSIALLAMRFGASVAVGGAVRLPPDDPGFSGGGAGGRGFDRLGLRVELSDVFGPEEWSKHPDPVFYITARYRHSLELLIRRFPEQYFWMHNVWKSRPRHERLNRAVPGTLRNKLEALPWLGESGASGIIEQSRRDAEWLAANGVARLP
ncbi:MAG: lysophospholipid acyltransferase family protein [Planctomycetota bacterium]